ncbi:hypothetical protein MKEN_00625000 [Mycena kentingensis (nom. inval.)]|nr:hypothetical protein MKEN_00625000 [Mycena kentingensis (nom. inval.)]
MRSLDDQALINALPRSTPELFRASIFTEAYVLAHAAKFANFDWVDGADLRQWLERDTATLSTPAAVKTEPMDISPPLSSAPSAQPVYRVVREGSREVLDICDSDSHNDIPATSWGRSSNTPKTAGDCPPTRSRRATSEEVEDVSVAEHRRRAWLPADGRYNLEPAIPDSPPPPVDSEELPPSSPPPMSTSSDGLDSTTDEEIRPQSPPDESAPRAPKEHRSPGRFNQHADWQPSGTDWGDDRIQSFVRPAHFKPTSHRDHVEAVEYIFTNPPFIPVPPVETALIVDLDHCTHDLPDGKKGGLVSVLRGIRNEGHDSWDGSSGTALSDSKPMVVYGPGEEAIKSYRARLTCKGGYECEFVDRRLADVQRHGLDQPRQTCANEGATEAQHVTEAVNVIKARECPAVDSHGNRCKGRAILLPNKFPGAPMYIACSGFTPAFNKGHRRDKITVDYDLFLKAFHGEPMFSDKSKDTGTCAQFTPPSTGFKRRECPHAHVIDGTARQGKTVHRDCQASCTIFYPRPTPIRSFRACPGGGTIVVTCVPQLLALIDEVRCFEADTTFKRVAGSFNEWEVVIFYSALNRNITIARVYIDRADTDFFEAVFDELRAVKLKLTGTPIAFKRLVPGGNLIAFNSDMESAQVVAAARSFLKTNHPEHSGIAGDAITNEFAKRFAPEIVKLCTTHAKRAILDFKNILSTADYTKLLNFMDEITSLEKLEEVSAFIKSLNVEQIQHWWDHKALSEWILRCLPASTTNSGEAQHHWTNKLTGIGLPLVEAIETAREVVLRVCADVQLAFRSGVVTNPNNFSFNRKARAATRHATQARKVQATRERDETTTRIQGELETAQEQQRDLAARIKLLKAQKKEAGPARKRGQKPAAGDSSCGRVKSATRAVGKTPAASAAAACTEEPQLHLPHSDVQLHILNEEYIPEQSDVFAWSYDYSELLSDPNGALFPLFDPILDGGFLPDTAALIGGVDLDALLASLASFSTPDLTNYAPTGLVDFAPQRSPSISADVTAASRSLLPAAPTPPPTSPGSPEREALDVQPPIPTPETASTTLRRGRSAQKRDSAAAGNISVPPPKRRRQKSLSSWFSDTPNGRVHASMRAYAIADPVNFVKDWPDLAHEVV